MVFLKYKFYREKERRKKKVREMRLEKDLEIIVVMGVVGNIKSWKHFPIPRLPRYNNIKPYSSSKVQA